MREFEITDRQLEEMRMHVQAFMVQIREMRERFREREERLKRRIRVVTLLLVFSSILNLFLLLK